MHIKPKSCGSEAKTVRERSANPSVIPSRVAEPTRKQAMADIKRSNKNIALYLLLVVGLWAFCFVTLKLLLMPYSIAYAASGKMTIG